MAAGMVVSGRPSRAPIVLIHGLGESHHVWDRVTPILEDIEQIIAINIGRSGSIEKEADAIAALIPTRSTIVGHSRGGLVGTAIAERYPDVVDRLVLLCTPWSNESRTAARRPAERALGIPVLGPAVWVMAAGRPTGRALASTFAPNTAVPKQFVTDIRSRGRRDLVHSSMAIDAYLAEHSLLDRLGVLGVDAHLVFGTLDARVAPIRHQTTVPTNVRITLLAGVGHSPQWEAPQATAALIASASPG